MSNQPTPQQPEDNNSLPNMEQNSTGDGNQNIGINQSIAINQVEGNFTFNKTEIQQISVDEIKTRQLIETSPYKGLKTFEPTDKDLFFGRDLFLKDLANELEQTNFILLLGASGSGKSSVIRAGLIPSLQQKKGSQLVNLIFRPDKNPFKSFYASLLSKYSQEEAEIASYDKVNVDTLTQVVKKLKQPESYWFILIDQFEELFTTTSPEKREEFINNLVKLTDSKIADVKILATMRADFLDKLSPYPKLVNATNNHRPMITEMQPDELRMAIEQPAARHGVVFETGLVEEIIKDVQRQAGYLPLLQYTLNLVWEEEVKTGSINDHTLNISTYHQLGGVRGALQNRVDSIYGGLSQEEKLATQKIFLKLVGIGGDLESETEWKPIRRREFRSEFEGKLEQAVLVKLINANLLVSDSLREKPQSTESTVEIAHEILLTSWTTLNKWIKENRLAIALRNRLNDDVARWKKNKPDNELWGGSKLEQVVELSKNKTFIEILGGFSEDANQFISASVNLRERQRRRTILVLGGFSAVVSILAGFIGYQLWRTSIAETNARLRALAAESETLFNSGLKYSALAESLKAGQQLQQASWVNPDTRTQVVATLRQVLYGQDYKAPKTLKGHSLGFISVSLSPDGKTIASGGDNTVKLWDISTGKLLKTIKAHYSYPVTSVSFSPDGKTIASASYDSTVKIWDISTGKLIKTFKGHSVGILSVSFSPDGKTIASASGDKTVKLWNVSTGKELKTLKGHSDTIKSLSFSPDGKTIASASDDKTVKLWDINTGKEIKTFKGHSNFVNSVSFSPDGKTIASASFDQTVKLWDIRTGKEIKTFRNSFVSSTVSFSPDGKILSFTSASGNDVGLWDVTTGKLIKTFDNYLDGVNNIIFSPDGKTIVFVSNGKTVKLWDMNTSKQVTTFQGHSKGVSSVSLSPDGKTIASASSDNTVKLWDISTGKLIKTFKGHSNWIHSVSLSPDGKTIASASRDKTVKLWDITTGKELKTLKGHSNSVNSVIFSPDGKTIASGSVDNTVKLWDVSTGKIIKTLKGDSSSRFGIKSVSFSPDGKTIASGSSDYTVKLWDITTGKEIKTLKGHSAIISDVSFSPDGKTIASPSDNTVKLWDVSTGKEIKTFKGHPSFVSSVSFSADGKTIASASDNTVKLWDINTGKEIKTLKGHSDGVLSVSFSPDGKTIASASNDKTVKLWNLDLEDLLAQGCNWLQYYLPNHPETLEELKVCQNPEILTAGAYDLVIQGQELARTADLKATVEKFKKAQQFDSNIDLNPETKELDNNPKVLARKLVAKSLVEKAIQLASKQGDLEGAVEKLKQAQQIDPNIDFNPTTKELDNDPKAVVAEFILAPLILPGIELLSKGEIKEAIAVYNKVSNKYPNLQMPPGHWNLLCMYGSFYNQAKDVMFACEKVVAFGPKNANIKGSRGIARALTGDYKGAIEDFETVVKLTGNSKRKSQVQGWINDLQNGKNPFTPKILEDLRKDFEGFLQKELIKQMDQL